MTIAEMLVEKLNVLPPEKQRELLAFAESLVQEAQTGKIVAESLDRPPSPDAASKPSLGERLRAIRSKIVESGEGLLTIEEIEQEMTDQRDRLRHLGE